MAFADLPAFSPPEIKAIAHYQKKTLFWFGMRFIISGFFIVLFSAVIKPANPTEPSGTAFAVNTVLMAAHWSLSAVMFYHLFQLAQALRLFSRMWICWAVTAVAFFVGILGLIYILAAIIQANRALKAQGIQIGFFGADPASLDEFMRRSAAGI